MTASVMVRCLAVLSVAGTLLVGQPAAEANDLPEYTGDEFVALFPAPDQPGLAPLGPDPAITGNAARDRGIREQAEWRGYMRRPVPDRPLARVDGFLLQPEAADAWHALRDDARTNGHDIRIVSSFRNISTQRSNFVRRLSGTSSSAIEAALRWVAPPGYSKHHTGYAIDIVEGAGSLGGFVSTGSYAWLFADNFANAKRHGWVPSYPPNAGPFGPDPEPWELVYVGVTAIRCGKFEPTPDEPFCDVDDSVFIHDINWAAATGITTGCNPPPPSEDPDRTRMWTRFCPYEPVTRGQMAAFLVRAFDLPPGQPRFGDTADSIFRGDIDALAAADVARGCDPPENTRFCPGQNVTRGEMAAFLARVLDLHDPLEQGFFDTMGSVFEGDINALAGAGIARGCDPPENTRFCPGQEVTRGQMAAFLARAAGSPR